jgi:hypothetical protein
MLIVLAAKNLRDSTITCQMQDYCPNAHQRNARWSVPVGNIGYGAWTDDCHTGIIHGNCDDGVAYTILGQRMIRHWHHMKQSLVQVNMTTTIPKLT